MSPEVQAYIDAKFAQNYWNQIAMLSLLGAILVSKVLIYYQLVALIKGQQEQKHQNRETQHQNVDTQHKLDVKADTLERKVDSIPEAVVQRINDKTPVEGDFPRPYLPPP